MAIHLDPFRLYHRRLCLNHGLVVEILRSTHSFLLAYKHLLEINGKRQSNVKEIRTLMDKAGLKPRENISAKEREKLIGHVLDLFTQSLKDMDDMFKSLKTIINDDETFLFRAIEELRKLYHEFSRISHIPDHMLLNVRERFLSLMHKMSDVQCHAWVISKAHSRNRIKIEEIEIYSTWVQRRRIRKHTIELDHIRNKIEPLAGKIDKLKVVKTHEDIHKLHEEIAELLNLYREEMHDLQHIMHEAEVIIRRTEKLFSAIEQEAETLKIKEIKRDVHNYAKKFSKLVTSIETQARREHIHIQAIVKSMPSEHEALSKLA